MSLKAVFLGGVRVSEGFPIMVCKVEAEWEGSLQKAGHGLSSAQWYSSGPLRSLSLSKARLAVEQSLWVAVPAGYPVRCAFPPSCSSSVTFIASFLSPSKRKLAKAVIPQRLHLHLSHLSRFQTSGLDEMEHSSCSTEDFMSRQALLTTRGCVRIKQQHPLAQRLDWLPTEN